MACVRDCQTLSVGGKLTEEIETETEKERLIRLFSVEIKTKKEREKERQSQRKRQKERETERETERQ